MATLEIVPIGKIDPNPHRDLATYPWIERKLEHLQRSIADVGLWEGVIARRVPNGRFQIAFGHHRVEAAKRENHENVALIVRDLSDGDMLKFMGRENGEDYSTEFLIMLNTWEGAVKFLFSTENRKPQPIEVARFLGWIRLMKAGNDGFTDVAAACYAAHALITGGYLGRQDLVGLSVGAAREIVERANAKALFLEEQAKKQKVPHREFEAVKQRYGASVRHTAQEVREGKVLQRDIRDRVDDNAYEYTRPKAGQKAVLPLFSVFADAVRRNLKLVLEKDSNAQHLQQIADALSDITLAEDEDLVADVRHELHQIGIRAERWDKRLTRGKVTRLAIEKGGA